MHSKKPIQLNTHELSVSKKKSETKSLSDNENTRRFSNNIENGATGETKHVANSIDVSKKESQPISPIPKDQDSKNDEKISSADSFDDGKSYSLSSNESSSSSV